MEEGYDFIDLLNHVSRTGKLDLDKKYKRDECEEEWIAVLERLFKHIITFPITSGTKRCNFTDHAMIESENYTDQARKYLIENEADSSKKYLFTAGQLLDHSEGGREWWNYSRRKVLYLSPNKIKEENIASVTFGDIIDKKEKISSNLTGRESASNNLSLKKYWEWTVEILRKCNLI